MARDNTRAGTKERVLHQTNWQNLREGTLSNSYDRFVPASATEAVLFFALPNQRQSLGRQSLDFIEVLCENIDSPLKTAERAEIVLNSGIEMYSLGKYLHARASFLRAVEILDSLILLDASKALIEQLALVLSWLARAERRTGKTSESRKSYERALSLYGYFIRNASSRAERKAYQYSFGLNLLGYSKTLNRLGERKRAASKQSLAYALLHDFFPTE